MKIITAIVFGVLIATLPAALTSETKWKLNRIECPSTICSSAYCNITRPSRHKQLFNLGCQLDEPQSNVRVHVLMFYRFKRYQKFLLDVDLDLCDYLGPRTSFQPLADALMPFVRNFTNVDHPCPFIGLVQLTRVPIDQRYLHGFALPSGQYRFEANVYDSVQNMTIFKNILYVTVSSSNDLAMG